MLRTVLIASLLLAGPASAADEMVCAMVKKPVCALKSDGTRATFDNACQASRAQAKTLHDGACEGGDMCSMLYKPVCGLQPGSGNQHTYSSVCVAEHANAKIAHDGACGS